MADAISGSKPLQIIYLTEAAQTNTLIQSCLLKDLETLYLLVKDLSGLMKTMDQSSVDESGLEDLLQGLVYVHSTSAKDGVDGHLTGTYI